VLLQLLDCIAVWANQLTTGMVAFEGDDPADGIGNRAILLGELGIDILEVLDDDLIFGFGKLVEMPDGIVDGFVDLGVCHGLWVYGLLICSLLIC